MPKDKGTVKPGPIIIIPHDEDDNLVKDKGGGNGKLVPAAPRKPSVLAVVLCHVFLLLGILVLLGGTGYWLYSIFHNEIQGSKVNAPLKSSFSAGAGTELEFYRDLEISRKVNATSLAQFLNATVELMAQNGDVIGVKLEPPPLSANTLLVYFSDMEEYAVLKAVADVVVDGKSLGDFEAYELLPVLRSLHYAFSENGIREWGAMVAKNRRRRGSVVPLSMGELSSYLEGGNNSKHSKTMYGGQEGANIQVRGAQLKEEFHELCIPLVIHVLQFRGKSGKVMPEKGSSHDAQLWVDRVNYLYSNSEYDKYFSKTANSSTDTKIRFHLKEHRDDHMKHPYLLLRDYQLWKYCDNEENEQLMLDLAEEHNADPTSVINVYVCGYNKLGGLGYGYIPDEKLEYGEDWVSSHVWLRYDMLNMHMHNSMDEFWMGGSILAHELGHHLGLFHPHDKGCDGDGDNVGDTPSCNLISDQEYSASLAQLCDTWRLGLQWPSGTAWKASEAVGGHHLSDMVSCPNLGFSHIDPVFNIMDYIPPSCFSHFTPGQVRYMHDAIKRLRPKLYKSRKGQCTDDKIGTTGQQVRGGVSGTGSKDQVHKTGHAPTKASFQHTHTGTHKQKQDGD